MNCNKCQEKAIFKNPELCKEHFIEYFEDKVKQTIDKFELAKKEKNIAVAVSGGKDSLTVLYLLKKFGFFKKRDKHIESCSGADTYQLDWVFSTIE